HTVEHVNAILRDELPILCLRGGGVAFVVLFDQLDLAAGDLVVDLLEGHLEPVEHVLTSGREDAGEGPQIADANRLDAGRRTREQEHNEDDDGDESHHDASDYLEGRHGVAGVPRALGVWGPYRGPHVY